MKTYKKTILVLLTLVFILVMTSCAKVDCSIQAVAGGAQSCETLKAEK